MRRSILLLAAIALVSPAVRAAVLFSSASQSNWSVSQSGSKLGTMTLTTDGEQARVDWKPASGAAASLVSTNGKIWLKATGGDTELAGVKDALLRTVAPALLLPATTSPKDKVTTAGAKLASYNYGGVTATYTSDSKGPSKIEIAAGKSSYSLVRESLKSGVGDMASFYEVKPKASRFAGLKSMAGGVLGPSDSSVSASAGVRGMDPETALKEGIDLYQVDKLLERDAAQHDARREALKKFQKDGKLGGAQ